MPVGQNLPRYRIADLVVDVGRRTVVRGMSEIHLSKLSFEVLRTLIEATPNVVSNDELSRAVWRGVVVGPESVTQRVKLLRDALGDDPAAPRYIIGLRGQGYRILPPVTLESHNPDAATPEAPHSSSRRAPSRAVGVVLAATAFTVALAYFAVDQLLLSKRGAASAPVTRASEGSTSRNTVSPVTSAPPAETAFAPPPYSVAVLSFANMSGDPSQEYFSDGLSEELLNDLSRINELQVAARTSSFSFKGKDTDIATIGRKLNVRTVLEGSVRRAGQRMRVTAQLNDVLTGYHLWSQTYDRNLGDVLKLQTEIASAVANALKVTLLKDAASKLEAGWTDNPEAFDAYLRASKTYWTIGGEKDLQAAIASYGKAIRLDPNYALAYAARSIAVMKATDFASTVSAARAGFETAEADARKASALAPNMSEAHLALAIVHVDMLEFTQANQEYERAVALAPGDARALRDYGLFAVQMGHGDSGLTALRRALALDPLNRQAHMQLGYGLLALRRYREALTEFKETEALDPPSPGSLADTIGIAYYLLGDFESASAACERMRDSYLGPYCLAMTYDKLGRHADAESMLAKDRALEGDPGAVHLSQVYAQWGRTAQALASLQAAMRLRDPDLASLKDPLFDPLRKERPFQAIERQLKFPD